MEIYQLTFSPTGQLTELTFHQRDISLDFNFVLRNENTGRYEDI